MRSTLDQALLALLNEDVAKAEELFHDFVLQRARKINESIVEDGDVDEDAIADEQQSNEKEDDDESVMEGRRVTSAARAVVDAAKEALDTNFSNWGWKRNDLYISAHGIKADRFADSDIWAERLEATINAALAPYHISVTYDRPTDQGAWVFKMIGDPSILGESVQGVTEGKSFKRNDDDEEDVKDKRKEDKQKRDEKKDKKQVEEGKTFKRGKDGDDEEVADKKKKDKERKDAAKDKKKVEEGKLELVQGDDGTLVVTHTPEASAEGDMAPVEPLAPVAPVADVPPAPMGAPVATPDAGMTPDLDPMDDLAGDDLDVPVAPETDMDFDLSDDDFDSLGESLVTELEKILVNTKDGDFAVGGKAKQEKRSPVPNVAAKDRMSKAGPTTIKSPEHNGYDREPAETAKTPNKFNNSVKSTKDAMQKAETGSKALLTQIKDDKAAKSPIDGKK